MKKILALLTFLISASLFAGDIDLKINSSTCKLENRQNRYSVTIDPGLIDGFDSFLSGNLKVLSIEALHEPVPNTAKLLITVGNWDRDLSVYELSDFHHFLGSIYDEDKKMLTIKTSSLYKDQNYEWKKTDSSCEILFY